MVNVSLANLCIANAGSNIYGPFNMSSLLSSTLVLPGGSNAYPIASSNIGLSNFAGAGIPPHTIGPSLARTSRVLSVYNVSASNDGSGGNVNMYFSYSNLWNKYGVGSNFYCFFEGGIYRFMFNSACNAQIRNTNIAYASPGGWIGASSNQIPQWTGSAGGNQGLSMVELEDVPSLMATTATVGAAYSLRPLTHGSSFRVVNVRRSSDSNTADMYADSFGVTLSTSSGVEYTTWLSNATGYVTTWYDQSANSNHAVQTSASNQPILQMEPTSQRYAVYFAGGDAASPSYLNFTSNIPTLGVACTYLTASNSSQYQTLVTTSGDPSLRTMSTVFIGGTDNGVDFTTGTGAVVYSPANGAAYTFSSCPANGDGTWGQVVATRPSGIGALSMVAMGKAGAVPSRALHGYVNEMVLYTTTPSSTDAANIRAHRPLYENSNLVLPASQIGEGWQVLYEVQNPTRVSSGTIAYTSSNFAAKYQTYPPTPLTSYSNAVSGQAYGNGTYITSSSSDFGSGEVSYAAFDSNPNTFWTTWQPVYSASTGAYTGALSTPISGSNYAGEWLQIQLPAPTWIAQYTLSTRPTFLGRGPSSFQIAGSIDGSTWVLVDSQTTGLTTWTTAGFTFTPAAPGCYTYYRLVVNANNKDGFLSIAAWSIVAPSSTQLCAQTLRFPPTALTAYTTGVSSQAYGNGTYVVSASSEYGTSTGEYIYAAFDSNPNTCWTTSQMVYSTSTGAYTGAVSTTISGSNYAGEWLQMQLPYPVLVQQYTLSTRQNVLGRGPSGFQIAGSIDGTTWTLVDAQTGVTNWTNSGLTFIPSSPGFYSYYRLVANALNVNGSYFSISEWSILTPYTPVTRIGYYMQNNMGNSNVSSYAFASIDPFTPDLNQLCVPDANCPFIVQTNVTGLNVVSNYPTVTDVTNHAGRLQIWNTYYVATTTFGDGSSNLYDYDDSPVGVTNGHGALMVCDMTLKQIVLSWSHMAADGAGPASIGFGTQPTGQPNWTFAYNGAYNWKMQVLVKPSPLPPVTSGLLAMYTGDTWSASGWQDISGNNNHATTFTGTVAVNKSALNGHTYISGAAATESITFPANILPPVYTLFHVTKYNGTTRKRILTSTNSFWLSGHWNNMAGVAYHLNWVTPQSDSYGSNWVMSTDQNALYRSNRMDRTSGSPGSPSYAQLSINAYTEVSDWACACVIVFNRTLTAAEILTMEAWIGGNYGL